MYIEDINGHNILFCFLNSILIANIILICSFRELLLDSYYCMTLISPHAITPLLRILKFLRMWSGQSVSRRGWCLERKGSCCLGTWCHRRGLHQWSLSSSVRGIICYLLLMTLIQKANGLIMGINSLTCF